MDKVRVTKRHDCRCSDGVFVYLCSLRSKKYACRNMKGIIVEKMAVTREKVSTRHLW